MRVIKKNLENISRKTETMQITLKKLIKKKVKIDKLIKIPIEKNIN